MGIKKEVGINKVLKKENDKLQQTIEQLKVVESMQKEIVNAGGRFFGSEELMEMTIADFIKHFSPNGIVLHVVREGRV